MPASRPSLLTLTLVSLAVCALFLLSPLQRLLPSAAAAISPPPAETSVLSDDFNDNRLDATKWRYSNASSASVILEQNQRLEIPLRPNTAAYYGVQTLGTHDLREKTVSVDLVQATSQGGWAETYFQIKRDEGNHYHMVSEPAPSSSTPGPTASGTAPCSPSTPPTTASGVTATTRPRTP